MLEDIHYRFIDKYLQTYSIEEAAREAGIPHKEALSAGIDMLNNPEIQQALKERTEDFKKAFSVIDFDKERIAAAMMLQYERANKMGKTKEAVDILAKIAEVKGIDFKAMKLDPINFIINNLDENRI